MAINIVMYIYTGYIYTYINILVLSNEMAEEQWHLSSNKHIEKHILVSNIFSWEIIGFPKGNDLF